MFKTLVVATVALASVGAQEWNYDKKSNRGPSYWHQSYPECNKLLQSPINIKTKDAVKKKIYTLPHLDTPIFWTDEEYDITNDGHTVIITGGNMDRYQIRGGLMDEKYNLESVRLHWDSEHELNGKREKAEIQFVFKIMAPNLTPENDGDLYTIVAVLLKTSGKNRELDGFFDALPLIEEPFTNDVAFFNLGEFLPRKFGEDFYTYRGSLSYPPCTQKVQWHIAQDKISISSNHLKALKKIKDQYGRVHDDKCFREEQKVNARHVYKSFGSTGSSKKKKKSNALFGNLGF